jgi:hypothetical protein
MSADIKDIVAKAEADARASADALSQEARERSAQPVLPPIVADNIQRVEPAAKVSPQIEKRETRMVFDSTNETNTSGSVPDPYWWTRLKKKTPFYINVWEKNPNNWVFSISNGTIINGTNGGPFAIKGLKKEMSVSKDFIVLEAEVTNNPFKISDDGFEVKMVDADDTDEVKITDGEQEKIRLLIGKVLKIPDSSPAEYTALQACYTSYKTGVSFHNGVPVYVLHAAATHQSMLERPEPPTPAE